MGVTGLWQLVQEAAQWRTLEDLASARLLKPVDGEARPLRIGIDASIWLVSATRIAERDGVNAFELLFHWTVNLLAVPLRAIFVFDGPLRPRVKRGRPVSGRPLLYETEFANLVDACGFARWKGRAEAEVDLDAMFELGYIDLILTDDGDSLVFGNATVLRNPDWFRDRSTSAAQVLKRDPIKERRRFYEASRVDDILALDQRIFVALLSGGDYGPGALDNVPPHTAAEKTRRATRLHQMAKEPLDRASETNRRLLSLALVESLRNAVEADGDEVDELLRQEKHDWLPVVREALRHHLEPNEVLDEGLLGNLFDLEILRLYFRPTSCSGEEFQAWQRTMANRPVWPWLADWMSEHLPQTSKERQSRTVMRTCVGADLTKRLLAAGFSSRIRSCPHLVRPLAARWSSDRKQVAIAFDASELLDGPFKGSLAETPALATVELSACFSAAIEEDWLRAGQTEKYAALLRDCLQAKRFPVKQTAPPPPYAEVLAYRAKAPLGPGKTMLQPTLPFTASKPSAAASLQKRDKPGKKRSVFVIDLTGD